MCLHEPTHSGRQLRGEKGESDVGEEPDVVLRHREARLLRGDPVRKVESIM